MKEVTVFYAGLLYGEYSHKEWNVTRRSLNGEIYNGCWIYETFSDWSPTPDWYRADGIPALESSVPKELRLSVLLMQ